MLFRPWENAILIVLLLIDLATGRKPSNLNGNLQEDISLRSPLYAATFVIGHHVNGLTEWKTKDDISLKEIEHITFRVVDMFRIQ